MEIIIRNAGIKDSEFIAQLSDQLGYSALNSEIENRIDKILGHPDHCIYVATVNEKVVGWVHGFYALRVESNFFVEIGGLVVDQKFRKQGIGNRLVDSVITWAKTKKCNQVRVRCNVIRTESHQFYGKIGFELNKEQKIFNKRLE